jgi:O-antigen ligase
MLPRDSDDSAAAEQRRAVPIPWSQRMIGNLSDPEKWAWCADRLAIAVAVALPWSTTATIILIAVWLVMRLPMRDFAALSREVLTPAGGLPVALWAIGTIGVLWSDAPPAERLNGLSSYYKLLAIPLLLAQFRCFEPGEVRRTECGIWVLAGFLISCTMLLVVSWGLVLLPDLPWRGRNPDIIGVPVKDRITQGTLFVLCVFGLVECALVAWRQARRALAVGLLILSLSFLANVLFVATSRTAVVVVPVLLLVFGASRLGWQGLVGGAVAVALLAAGAWQASPALRQRITVVLQEARDYQPSGPRTSTGERLEFWRRSVLFIADAPLLGHGTGSIPEQFRRSAVGQAGMAGQAPQNPHNQLFAVAIEIGLIGAVLLVAMWFAHLRLFVGTGLLAGIGLIVVVQNVVSSLFNSHLFDFTEGWAYVWGVGVIGGMILRRASRTTAARSRFRSP